mgnify:CR=1 FL=1
MTQFEDRGVEVHQASADQLGAFKDEMAPVYDWWTGEVDGAEKLIEFARENQ